MISCLTDGWDGKDDGAMVNVVDKVAQKMFWAQARKSFGPVQTYEA